MPPNEPLKPARHPNQYLRQLAVFPDPTLLQHPQIPPALWGVNPRNLYGPDWWGYVRNRTYEMYNFRCWACGVPSKEALYRPGRLDAHETYEYQGIYQVATFTGTCALCTACHDFIHRGRMKTLLLHGKIGQSKVDGTLQRGMEILARANLRPVNPSNIANFQLPGWKLLLDGRQFSQDDCDRIRVARRGSGKPRTVRALRPRKKKVHRKRRIKAYRRRR
jgi:hypothetical protein